MHNYHISPKQYILMLNMQHWKMIIAKRKIGKVHLPLLPYWQPFYQISSCKIQTSWHLFDCGFEILTKIYVAGQIFDYIFAHKKLSSYLTYKQIYYDDMQSSAWYVWYCRKVFNAHNCLKQIGARKETEGSDYAIMYVRNHECLFYLYSCLDISSILLW